MPCACANRARDMLRTLGYRMGEDRIWRDDSGHAIPDAKLEDHHFQVAGHLFVKQPIDTVRAFVRAWMA